MLCYFFQCCETLSTIVFVLIAFLLMCHFKGVVLHGSIVFCLEDYNGNLATVETTVIHSHAVHVQGLKQPQSSSP